MGIDKSGRDPVRFGHRGRRLLRLAPFALLMAAGFARAEESCSLAGNGICEEPVLGPGYCAAGTDTNDCADAFVLPDSADRRLTAPDLRYLPPDVLRLARNEIFARHGFAFRSDDLRAFFAARSWYRPADGEVSLSAIEQHNVDLIRAIEDGRLNAASRTSQPPDGRTPSPLTAYSAELVAADGTTRLVFVDGVRARVVNGKTGATVLIRDDRDDLLFVSPEDGIGTATAGMMFPPEILEPYVQALGIVPQPVAPETWDGEPMTRVRFDWQAEEGSPTLVGEAVLSDDGIFVEVNVGGIYWECCGGEPDVPWRLEYRLRDIVRERPSQDLMEPPALPEWHYAG